MVLVPDVDLLPGISLSHCGWCIWHCSWSIKLLQREDALSAHSCHWWIKSYSWWQYCYCYSCFAFSCVESYVSSWKGTCSNLVRTHSSYWKVLQTNFSSRIVQWKGLYHCNGGWWREWLWCLEDGTCGHCFKWFRCQHCRTSINSCITSIVEVVREGRCALVSSFASYKYMIMYEWQVINTFHLLWPTTLDILSVELGSRITFWWHLLYALQLSTFISLSYQVGCPALFGLIARMQMSKPHFFLIWLTAVSPCLLTIHSTPRLCLLTSAGF